jgi:outer membrane protein OmpA-like peptidoglycan-associated protein
MIPKYFRCGDPAKKCPLAVKREIIKDGPSFACPCKNEQCQASRDYVSFIEGITKGRAKLFYVAVGVFILSLLFLLTLGGGNPVLQRIAELRQRLEPLVSELQTLEAKAKPTGTPSALPDLKPLDASVAELQSAAQRAIADKDTVEVANLRKRLAEQKVQVRTTLETLDPPRQGQGAIAADARSLLGKFVQLQEDAELSLEGAIAKDPSTAPLGEDFLAEIQMQSARARRLASPATTTSPPAASQAHRANLAQIQQRLESTEKLLNSFAPPPPLPFPPDQADLVIAAPEHLAKDLAAPLVSAWSSGEVTAAGDGNHYLIAKDGRKILIKPSSVDNAFKMLAAGECAVLLSDRPATTAHLSAMGADYRESRSVAEVIALDALTLLVHPEQSTSQINVSSPMPLRIAAGPEDSPVRMRALDFGLPFGNATELSGETAALADINQIGVGFYHEEGENLRAKRLAVQAAEGTLALKPSPFAIATEDYLYSFRIVAWTPSKASEAAMHWVKFATSNEGQAVVAKQGFIDLRLTGQQEDVPAEILAALGSAIGSSSVSSALRLSTNFRFETGKASLDLKALADLERLPRFVFEKYPSHQVVILGFTDSTGGAAINLPLSKERAEAVAGELRRSKVDAQSAGLGPVFPVDTNATEFGKAKNRRAEAWVVRP